MARHALAFTVILLLAFFAPRAQAGDTPPAPERPWASGIVRAVQDVVVASAVGGRLTEVGVQVGDRVKSGDGLAAFDSAAQEMQVRLAEIELEAAKTRVDHFDVQIHTQEALTEQREKRSQGLLKLHDAGAVDEASLMDARMAALEAHMALDDLRYERQEAALAVDHAKVALDVARRQLEDFRVLAPFAGVVVEIWVTPGQTVEPGARVARLLDPERLVADVPVPWSEVALWHPGERAEIQCGTAVLTGPVRTVAPAADPATGTVEVTVALPPNAPSRPGVPVKVRRPAAGN